MRNLIKHLEMLKEDNANKVECVAQLSPNIQKAISLLYEEYTNKLKPLLAFEETMAQSFPGPILNEIRALNDHVSRCYWADKSVEECLKEVSKAKGHLSRSILDAYKYLVIVYERRVQDFFSQYKEVCIAIVDDGKFLPELNRLHAVARDLAFQAKMEEAKAFPNKDLSYEAYENAVLAYTDVDDYISKHSNGLSNAAQYARDQTKTNYKFAFISAIIGTALGAIVTLLLNNM